MSTWQILVAGGLVGLGATMMVAAWVPARPNLHTALERMDLATDTLRRAGTTPARAGLAGAIARVRARVLPRAVDTFGLRRFATDLYLVDQRPEDLAARKIAFALVGLLTPALMTAVLGAVGIHPSLVIPAALGVVVAGGLFLLPDLDLRRDAARAREAMRRAVCVFCELVALERAADAGTTEALDRAVSIGASREFDRIRDALLHAELAGQPPWQGLTDLAERTGVAEIGDVADIMRLSGQDGAAVYTTLRARAASLRTQLLTAATGHANEASEHMIVPVALLGIAFMVLVGYPAFSRLLFT